MFQNVRVSLMSRESCSLSVTLDESPEVLAGDGEESLITALNSGVFNERRDLRKKRLRIRQKRLSSAQRALEPLDGEMPISDIISGDCNDFACSESMPEGD